MTKEQMIQEIKKMSIPNCFIQITFRGKDNLFFQYLGQYDFSDFVNYNFEYFGINEVENILRSTINSNCVIVFVK